MPNIQYIVYDSREYQTPVLEPSAAGFLTRLTTNSRTAPTVVWNSTTVRVECTTRLVLVCIRVVDAAGWDWGSS